MKNLCLLVIIGFISPLCSHSQAWSWERTLPNSTINDMKTLPSGVSILVGSFPGIQPVDSVTPADYFLLKIDSAGNIIGGIKKAPQLLQTGLHIGTDHSGNMYVTGTPFTPQVNNYYLQKYNTNGHLIWSRRLFIEGNISALDVNYGRVAFIGNYKKIMKIYDMDGITIKRVLGTICDPDYDFPCAYEKYDVFVANFSYEGTLVWADRYYSQMKSAYAWDEGYYFTKKDYDDYGLDVAIDKDQNILFVGGFSPHDDEPASKAIVAGIVIDVNVQDNYPPILIKLNSNGEYLWSYNTTDGILYVNAKKRVGTDKDGNIFMLYEHMHSSEGVYIKVNKHKPNGQLEWEREIKSNNPESFDLFGFGWNWHLDSIGMNHVVGNFTDWGSGNEEFKLIVFDKDNNLISDYGADDGFNSADLGIDADLNIYFSRGNNISKYWVAPAPIWFKDADNDGYSDGTKMIQQVRPVSYKLASELISTSGDCNDNNAAVNPGVSEECNNGMDDNCNGSIDEGCTVLITWYRDNDGDGWGRTNNPKVSVTQPRGYVDKVGDCNDGDPTIFLSAPELSDGKDNNCDGEVDEGLACRVIWYKDADGDGRGRTNLPKQSCIKPVGYVNNANDCNDGDATIYLGAPELCDGKDNDCDGKRDEGCTVHVTANESTTPAAKSDITVAALSINVWPNPANTELSIVLNDVAVNQKVNMVLMSADGRALQSQSIIPFAKGQQVRFDVRNMASGYYLLQVKQGALTEIKRVMILR